MKEIEIKILEINKKLIIYNLKKLGAKKIFEGEIKGMTFTSDNPLWNQDNNMLRLRQEGDNFFLCLKTKILTRSKAKIREEIEVEIKDFKNMKIILEKIGFFEQYKNKKYRTSFKLNNSRVEIEETRQFPTYLEIEAPSLGEIQKTVKLLGFTMNDTKAWSTSDLTKYYSSKK